MNHQNPQAIQPAAALLPLDQFAALLRSPPGRSVTILATGGVVDCLGLPALAAMTWSSWLGREGMQRAVQLIGRDAIGVPPGPGSQYAHEARWLAAGDLHERLLRQLDGKSSPQDAGVVLYLDPWAAMVDEIVSRARPHATRILIAEPDEIVVGEEKPYWEQTAAWLQLHLGVRLVSARALAELVTASMWETLLASTEVSWPAEIAASGGLILVEEGPVAVPEPSVLQAVLASHPPGSVLLISSHLPWYASKAEPLIRHCRAAWHPDNLTAATYAAVLSHTSHYVTAHRLPQGPAALACLPADGRCTILRDGQPQTGGRIAGRTMRSFATPPDIAASFGALMPSREPQPRPGPKAPATPAETMQAWWKGLGALSSGPVARPADGSPLAQPAADFAFLVCCFKYLQRFRIFVDSIVRQQHPLERIELCIATAGNPDGLYEYLGLLRMVHPALRITLVEVAKEIGSNKGKMLNAAFRVSTAPVVMPTDCDLVFPRTFVADMLKRWQPDRVIGCWRTPMTKELTAQILIGNLDPVEHFDVLCQQWSKEEEASGVRQGMLGYCQVVSRQAFSQVMYPEEFEGFNQSDIVFIDRLRTQIGVQSNFMKDYFVLHLSHSREWTGTKVFL